MRTVEIHDDLLDELATYKHALGTWWQPTEPAFPNRRRHAHARHAISRHVTAPAVRRANRLRAEQGLPPIAQDVTPHTLRYTYIASMFAAGADHEYVAAQVGHEDITTTNRIYRYVLRRKARGEIARAAGSFFRRSREADKGRTNPHYDEPIRPVPSKKCTDLQEVSAMARRGIEPRTPRFSVVCSEVNGSRVRVPHEQCLAGGDGCAGTAKRESREFAERTPLSPDAARSSPAPDSAWCICRTAQAATST